jgi:hypothetical protein
MDCKAQRQLTTSKRSNFSSVAGGIAGIGTAGRDPAGIGAAMSGGEASAGAVAVAFAGGRLPCDPVCARGRDHLSAGLPLEFDLAADVLLLVPEPTVVGALTVVATGVAADPDCTPECSIA